MLLTLRDKSRWFPFLWSVFTQVPIYSSLWLENDHIFPYPGGKFLRHGLDYRLYRGGMNSPKLDLPLYRRRFRSWFTVVPGSLVFLNPGSYDLDLELSNLSP